MLEARARNVIITFFLASGHAGFPSKSRSHLRDVRVTLFDDSEYDTNGSRSRNSGEIHTQRQVAA